MAHAETSRPDVIDPIRSLQDYSNFVMRDLVRQHGDRGSQPQMQIGHEGGRHQYAIAKRVHAVAQQHSPTAATKSSTAKNTVVVCQAIVWASKPCPGAAPMPSILR